jgi:Transposase DDE domain
MVEKERPEVWDILIAAAALADAEPPRGQE